MNDTPNYKRHGSRFKSRRRAVDLLFEAEFRNEDPVALSTQRNGESFLDDNDIKPVSEYTSEIVDGVAHHLDMIDQTIAANLGRDWTFDRLPPLDRAILRVATWEILFNPDVPPKVAVVEAVEIGSQYGHDSTSSYVNGVLDSIAAAEIRQRNARTTESAVSDQPTPTTPQNAPEENPEETTAS